MDASDASSLSGEYLRKRLSEIKADAIEQEWDHNTFSLAQDHLTDPLER
jgi:hypothetical protein